MVTLTKSVQLGEAIGDQWAIADGLKMITVTIMFEEDHEGARHALDDLLQAATRLDNSFFRAWYHAGVGIRRAAPG